MKTAAVIPAPGPSADTAALMREARRRQRRRRLVVGLAAVVVAAGGSGIVAAVHRASPQRPASQPRRKIVASHPAQPGPPGRIPRSVDTTLLMWPIDPGQYGGIYVDNLRTGQLLQPQTPGMDPGEFAPILPVGRWVVWVNDNAVSAVAAQAPGTPRVLGKTLLFAPSAAPGQVWLQYGFFGHGPNTVRSVAVADGHASLPIRLSAGTMLIAGTDAGLLLSADNSIQLWNPGGTPTTLPYSSSAQAFAVSPRLVAYDTGCTQEGTAPDLSYGGNYGYSACRTLRVFEVATGRLWSFTAPPGTSGWVPSHGGYWSVSAIARSGRRIAAEAAVPPDSRGVARVFVLSLAGSHLRAAAVPSSAAFLLSVTAWSADSSWLFYQGPGRRLWAYQVTTGRVRSSSTPCCQYAVLAPIDSRPADRQARRGVGRRSRPSRPS